MKMYEQNVKMHEQKVKIYEQNEMMHEQKIGCVTKI